MASLQGERLQTKEKLHVPAPSPEQPSSTVLHLLSLVLKKTCVSIEQIRNSHLCLLWLSFLTQQFVFCSDSLKALSRSLPSTPTPEFRGLIRNLEQYISTNTTRHIKMVTGPGQSFPQALVKRLDTPCN